MDGWREREQVEKKGMRFVWVADRGKRHTYTHALSSARPVRGSARTEAKKYSKQQEKRKGK